MSETLINSEVWTKIVLMACVHGKNMVIEAIKTGNWSAAEKDEIVKRLNRMLIK